MPLQLSAYVTKTINTSTILAHAKTLPTEGIIAQDAKGKIYLQVAEAFILDLIAMLPDKEFNKPPETARIMIFAEDEINPAKPLPEIGSKIKFRTLGAFSQVKDNQEHFLLAVDAPELHQLRKKYAESANLKDKSFVMEIAVKDYQGAEDQLVDKDTTND